MTEAGEQSRPRYRKVIVLAPSDVTTGGPELLHQLVHEIRSFGGDASIAYRPDAGSDVPERYRVYDVAPVRELNVTAHDCIVAPETMVRELPLHSPADRIIWWLSFDFFQSRRQSMAGRLLADMYKAGLLRVMTLLGVRHLFQSEYAREQLARRGMRGEHLSDYLSIEAATPKTSARETVILYNPKKGIAVTEQLRRACPDLSFAPIVNMTKAEVETAFRKAMVYVDFGEHPGKDRLPREAALLGAVVVVGARGAAANDRDVPLAPAYKLALDDDLVPRFQKLILDIFADFPRHQAQQDGYRKFIEGERAEFKRQVREAFFRPPYVAS